MRIIIVGAGKTGAYLANVLSEGDNVVRVVEDDRTIEQRLRRQLPPGSLVIGNGSSPETLERAGVLAADVVIAATGSDEVNLVVSTLAKFEFAVARVVARVNNPANAWMFNESMGVDAAVDQAALIARSIQEGLDLDEVFTIMRLGRDNHAIVQVEVRPRSQVVGRALREVELPGATLLVAVERGGSVIVPNGDTVLAAGDHVLAFTDEAGQARLHRVFA